MPLLNIAASVILVLLGTRHLRKGLDRLFGRGLLGWLEQMTENRWKAFAAGMAAGAVAPSSSALVFLSLQVLRQANLRADRMLAVFLGGCVGITVSVQLLAFRLQDYAGVFLVVGGIGFLFTRRAVFRGLGQCVLALGLIFLAMDLLGRAVAGVNQSQDLRVMFGVLEHYPLLILVAAAALTFLLQSSTASLGLAIGLALGGLISAAAVVPWVLGANLGIALTALLAGWGTLEGRRLALGNLLIKAVGALGVLLLAALAPALFARLLPGGLDTRAANLHTGFNLVVGLLTLPLLGPLARVVRFLTEDPASGTDTAQESYLDETLLESPVLALNQATREQMRLMDELKFMLLTTRVVAARGDLRLLAGVDRHAAHFARIREELGAYLAQMGGGDSLGEADTAWKQTLSDYGFEMESVDRLIRRELTEAVTRLPPAGSGTLPEEDRGRIDAFYQRTLARFEKADQLLMTRDPVAAGQFIREKEEINAWCRHEQRLLHNRTPVHPAEHGGPAANPRLVWEILACLRRINSHLTALAYAFSPQGSQEAARLDEAAVEQDLAVPLAPEVFH